MVDRKKARAGHGALVAVFFGFGLTAAAPLAAQTVPTGRQEYIVLGYDQHVYEMMRRVAQAEANPIAGNQMNSVVSFVASADFQRINYDHWEDGYEADPYSPAPATTFPAGSTLILGDGNAANGDACAFAVGACAGDTILAGMALNLASNLATGVAPCTTGAQVRCRVPVNPRGTGIRYDGGDSIGTSGGPLSLIHNQDPVSPYIGGATEVLPRQAFANATAYSIPAGEGLYAGDNTVTEPFKYVSINLVAFQNGTQVFINSPTVGAIAGGTVSVTLNKGQHYTSCRTWGGAAPFRCTGGATGGAIDGANAPGVTINPGTRISTNGPIGGLLFTGGDGNYATDFFPILPDLLHGTDYLIPSSGDAPGTNGDRPLNLYIFNPDPLNALTVSVTDSVGTVNGISVPANSTVDYITATGRDIPNSGTGPGPTFSTVRLTAARPFWGLTVHDHQSSNNDWGYAWLASAFLTDFYTASYAPGRQDPQLNPPPSCGTPPCDSLNRAPLWIGATQDNTRVLIDLDRDGLYDRVDTNSNDQPDGGVADPACDPAPPTSGVCLYIVNALQTLRVFDFTDYDNTGTRIFADKPVSVAYGQDTDQAVGSDPIIDTGYTVFPTLQRFLDPVLTVDKAAVPSTVPSTGGPVVFTATLRSYSFVPLTNLQIWDVLPPGITSCAAYVPGSTVVTYPNLAQSTADPACNDNGGAGPVRLDWALSPNTIGLDQTLTVRFAINIPAGPATTLTNTAFAQGIYGNSRFQPQGSARVVRTNVAMSKSVVDDGSPAPGDILTYTLNLANNGAAEATVSIRDAIPPGTSFVTGSITTTAPFTGVFSAGQNSVVWTAANWAAGATATLGFQVRINEGTTPGTVLSNSAHYSSASTPTFASNVVTTTVVGPILDAVKTRLGTGALHPLEVETFEIQVTNSGPGVASGIGVVDNLTASNATYVAGTLQVSVNGAPFTALTDAADADGGSFAGTTVQFSLATLGPASDVRFRFQARVNAGTSGQNLNNQAIVSASFVAPFGTNLLQVPILGTAFIAGHVFLDLDGLGTDNGDPDAVGVTVIINDITSGNVFSVLTDASGNYVAAVPPLAQVQAAVQNGTGNIPAGSTVTTAGSGGTASQTRTAGAAGTTTNNLDVGFDPPPLAITKTSSAGGTILPGQTTTYTVTVTNHTGATQTGVHLVDVVPANTTYVPGTAQVTTSAGNAVRVTEVYINGAVPDQCAETGTDFVDLTCTITLPALAPNYFVIVQGSDGNGGTDTTPDEDYARLTADPFGNFGTTLGANQLRFTRGGDENNWVGVITVVECVSANCATDPNGFRLVDVVEVTHLNAGTTGTATTTPAWTDLGRVVLFGGANGSGCSTADNDGNDHESCHVRLFPTGTNTINWQRDGTGGTETATSTVMAVQWGSAWTVQRVNVTGSNGGDGLNAAGEYNTAAISSVARANTWVWGTGFTNDPDTGESAEGAIVTLGNGVAQNPNETLVAVGTEEPESNVTVNFDVYTMTHPLLQVDYDFLADGNDAAATVNVATNAQTANRMALVYNGNDDDGTNYPLSIFSARYTANGQITLERRRTGSEFPAWVQGIGWNAVAAGVSVTCLPVYPPAALNCTEPSTNSSVVDPAAGFTLAPGQTLVLTFQASVNAGVAGGTVITNTAIIDTAQENPSQASVQDLVVVGAVTVEPNNAGFAAAGTTITFSHDVTNTGAVADSFVLTVTNDLLPWRIDLIDPDTGAIIATDLTGDGVWDVGGPVLSTGNMAPGAIRSYDVRATLVGSPGLGAQNTVRLNAVSTRSPAIADDAKDEITVISAFAPVVVTPDNSGLFAPGGTTSYAHYVVNRTGFNDTFDLYVASALSWPTTIYADTNGDGIFNPGVDLQVLNTAFLAPNAAQLIFVVTTDPGSPPGTVDVAQITAASRLNPLLFGAATDTTTVVSNEVHDLSGGGTRLVTPNVDAIYPGTILNDQSVNDRFELSVSAAGLYGQDAFPHPTVLRVDTNGDGAPDTQIAEDTDGDGTWNTVVAAFDSDGDLSPDVAVLAGTTLAYELVRHVDTLQVLERDFVTLTSRSMNALATDPDSVTATWVFAAVTRAGIRGVRVDRRGVVEFATGHQRDTASFQVFETDDPKGAFGNLVALHDEPARSPMPHSVRPILYRVRTRPVTRAYVVIVETETDGDRLRKGPFPVGDGVLAREVGALEARFDRMGVPRGDARVLRGGRATDGARPRVDRDASRRRTHVEAGAPGALALKIEVEGAGVVRVPAAELGALGSARPRRMRLYNLGRDVPFRLEPDGGSWALVFTAEALSTDYTSRNAYVLTAAGTPPFGLQTRLSWTGDPAWPGFRRIERNVLYVPTGPDGADPWVWDYVGVGSWPVVDIDPAAGDFDLPGFVASAEAVPVRLRLAGQSPHSHTVDAALNGVHVGSVTFDGTGRAILTGTLPADHLRETGNQLTLEYSSAPLPGTTPVDDGFVTIDHLDLGEWRTAPTEPLTAAAVLPYDGTLPALAGVQYLIVTHPLFRAQAERLAGLKAAEGLTTAIVDTETAYDRFSAGLVEAGALRSLVRYAHQQSGVLRFVLLLGDDTFDPRDFTGSGVSPFVPSLFLRDQSFGWIPSENAYADTDDDGKPDVAIGRLPAQTPAEADFLVDKVETQAAVLASRANRHVFVADNAGDEDADFPGEAQAALGLLPRLQTTTQVSVGSDVAAARAALDASWQDGVMLSHYFGHGGFNQWADESLLTNTLVIGAGSSWRPGIVLSWACLAQWYVDIYGRTVNEEMLFAPGGAVASFGPSGISAPAGHRVLFEKTYRALYVPGATLGEAIMTGKRRALEERETLFDVVHGFNLLGDPALRLPPRP